MAAMGLEEGKTEKKEDISEETDYPNPELYPVRKRQLRKFVNVLREQKKEPYAIMIDGAWGSGKSSFVKALEKELDQDEFIWIYAGSEKTVSEILGDISDQLTAVLKKNHIFVEKGGWIEKYFQAFSGMMDGFGMEVLSQMIKFPGASSEPERRKYLNDKLRELDKNVYLVIDDLDRCSREYQEIMFKVIRESTELTNCKTLFLVDRKKFLVGDDSQIEKYIGYRLELCTVDYREILNRIMDSVISDGFIERMSPVLRKGASRKELREKIYRLLEDNCNLLQSEIEKTEEELENTIKEFTTAKRTEPRTATEPLEDKKEKLETDISCLESMRRISKSLSEMDSRKSKQISMELVEKRSELQSVNEELASAIEKAEDAAVLLDRIKKFVLSFRLFAPTIEEYANQVESDKTIEAGNSFRGILNELGKLLEAFKELIKEGMCWFPRLMRWKTSKGEVAPVFLEKSAGYSYSLYGYMNVETKEYYFKESVQWEISVGNRTGIVEQMDVNVEAMARDLREILRIGAEQKRLWEVYEGR